MDPSQRRLLDANKRLGELLQIKRSPEQEAKVQDILDSYKDLIRRIELIEELDRGPAKKITDADLATTTKSRRPKGNLNAESSGSVGKSGKHHPVSFWEFLFSTRAQLREFADQKNIIRPKLLGTQFELHEDTIQAFRSLPLQESAVLQKRIRQYLAEEGWKKLPILDYNLLYHFSKLLEGFFLFATAIDQGQREADELFKIGNRFFSDYFLLRQDKGYYELLESALSHFFDFDDNSKYEKTGLLLFRRFFENRAGQIQFTDVAIGLVAIRDKNVPRLGDLELMFGTRSVESKQFLVNPELKLKIEQYFRGREQQVEEWEIQIAKIEILKNELLTITAESKFVFPLFREILIFVFQESGVFDKKLKEEIKKLLGHPLVLMKEILRFFFKELRPLLDGEIAISNKDIHIPLFQPGIFAKEIHNLEEKQTEVEKFLTKSPNFSLTFAEFYALQEKIKRQGIQAEQDELVALSYQLLEQISSTFFSLGESLLIVLFNHANAEKLNLQQKAELKKMSDQPVQQLNDKHRFIPFYLEKITARGYLHGLTPFGGVLECGKLAFNSALLYKNSSIMEVLRSEKIYLQKIQSLKDSQS